MKTENGVTLTALVIYIAVLSVIIGIMATVSSFFSKNMEQAKKQEQYAVEFNKFNMFFLVDLKGNKNAEVTENKVTFENGAVYEYKKDEKIVYRNETKIAEEINDLSFEKTSYTVNTTEKNIIRVKMNIGEYNNFEKTINYVLKYW